MKFSKPLEERIRAGFIGCPTIWVSQQTLARNMGLTPAEALRQEEGRAVVVFRFAGKYALMPWQKIEDFERTGDFLVQISKEAALREAIGIPTNLTYAWALSRRDHVVIPEEEFRPKDPQGIGLKTLSLEERLPQKLVGPFIPENMHGYFDLLLPPEAQQALADWGRPVAA